jgi:hypothetical protein
MMHDSAYDALNQILESDSSIRFAGLVDGNGRLILHGCRSGIVPLLSPGEAETSVVQAVLKMGTEKVFEEKLGRIEYVLTVYPKVKRVTVPLREPDLFLLISIEASCDHEKVMREKVFPALRSSQFREAIESH